MSFEFFFFFITEGIEHRSVPIRESGCIKNYFEPYLLKADFKKLH